MPQKTITAATTVTMLIVLLFGYSCLKRDSGGSGSATEITLLSFSRVEQAWQMSRGQGVTVAILDWQFDPKSPAAGLYLKPGSVVPGEKMGALKPWHGSWMVNIVHAVAPEAAIMPIISRGLKHDFRNYLAAGIRYAADNGASVVSSSQGPAPYTQELREAVEYALARGCLFVNVHPETIAAQDGSISFRKPGAGFQSVIHPGIVSVPAHPLEPDPARDIYLWPYDLDSSYLDGWGFSNAPPAVAGVIALMISANPALPITEIKSLLIETGEMREGFLVLNAEQAVNAAIARKTSSAL